MKVLTIIVFLSVLFGMATAAEAQEQILFEDDFTDNRNDWYQVDSEDCTIKVENGKYVFDHKREEGYWLTWKNTQIDQHKDFRIETTVDKVDGANNYAYGIVWGLKDVDNFYQFAITGNGYYVHGKLEDDTWHKIIDWAESPHINQENATNTLSIQKVGNQVKFYVNDQYVNEAEFGEFFGDNIGFVVYKKMRIDFDQILIAQSSTEEAQPLIEETPSLPEETPPLPEEPQPLVEMSEQKIALVIGNNDYKNAPLHNPENDAKDMARILSILGFAVTKKTNLNQQEMEEVINEFIEQIQPGDVALFYFSGHGSQVRGENYLVPVGENIRSEGHILYKAVKVGDILSQMEESGNRTNIVILDVCRELKGVWLFNKGLAAVNAPAGTFIAYATAPGMIAPDGTEPNSVYTKHLLEAIQIQGITITQVFENVLRAVEEETSGQQIPWTSSSLQEDFSFYPQQ